MYLVISSAVDEDSFAGRGSMTFCGQLINESRLSENSSRFGICAFE
jgi:hypothetical protein